MNRKEGEVGGGHTADTRGLAECLRADLFELLAGFGAEAVDGLIVDRLGYALFLVGLEALDGGFLAGDVAGVFEIDFDRLPEVASKAGAKRLRQGSVGIAGAPEPLGDLDAVVTGRGGMIPEPLEVGQS